MGGKERERVVRCGAERLYAVFSNLTATFPLLGILGT